MDSKIPVPTDNIFKFYALFSLLLFVFAIGSTLYVNRTTNDQLVSLLIDLETLKAEKGPTQPQQFRKAVVTQQLDVLMSDKRFYKWSLATLAALAALGMAYGFRKWHLEIQPVIDEAAKVQLDIAKLQLAKLQWEVTSSDA